MEKRQREAFEKEFLYNESRSNLLNWFPFQKNECGIALTHLQPALSDYLNTVVTLMKREECGEHMADYVFMFEDLLGEKDFYIDEKDWNEINHYIKADGTIILAFNNQMGIRNWSGAANDYTGKTFSSLNFMDGQEMCRGYSRQAIINQLHEQGYTSIDFYYPTPDFVFPTEIFSDKFLPSQGDLRGNSRAYISNGLQTFEENTVLDRICEDGQFPYFANSFLIFAHR